MYIVLGRDLFAFSYGSNEPGSGDVFAKRWMDQQAYIVLLGMSHLK